MIKKLVYFIFGFLGFILLLITTIYFYNIYITESKNVSDVAPVSTKFIDIENEQIAYSEIDNQSTTTIIFVGGLSAWNGTWERVTSESNKINSGQYNYIAIDLPPFGFSTPSFKNNYYRDTQTKRLKDFIDAKNLNSIILVGHSYGAGPAMEYAINNPTKVNKLVLIDAVLNIDEPQKNVPAGPVQTDWLRDFVLGTLIHIDPFALSQLKSFVFITDNINGVLLDNYTKYFSLDKTTNKLSAWLKDYVNDPLTYSSNSSDNYRNLSFPVRIIWGDKDTITPISGTDILLKTIPDVQLTTLINVGHIPMIEDYEQFDSAFAEVLKN